MPEARAEGAEYAVWPENWDAVQLMLASSTQWVYAGMQGTPVGLRYEALPMLRTVLGIDEADWPRVFRQVQILEHEVLRIRRST